MVLIPQFRFKQASFTPPPQKDPLRRHRVPPRRSHRYIPSSTSSLASSPPLQVRIAIVVTGSLQRYHLNSTVHHCIRPLIQQGHSVDYYLSLTPNLPDRDDDDDAEFMRHLTWDPSLMIRSSFFSRRPNIKQVQSLIHRELSNAGATVRHLVLPTERIDIDKHDLLSQPALSMATSYRAPEKGEDPYSRFPVLDNRDADVQQRTTKANHKFLQLLIARMILFRELKRAEEEQGTDYDYVFYFSDDTYWLKDLDFDTLLQTYSTFIPTKKTMNPRATQEQLSPPPFLRILPDILALSCSARDPPMHEREMIDHGILAFRPHPLENFLSRLLDEDYLVENCVFRISRNYFLGGKRGCSAKMLFKFYLELSHRPITLLEQAELPFQRAVHVVVKSDEKQRRVVPCFLEVCQSKRNPLDSHGVPKCSDIKF